MLPLKRKKVLGKPTHIHVLRHSYASHLDSQGVRPSIIQRLLGHRNLETTSNYLHPSDEEIDQNANDLLEAAIQLGADIPKDKRATVLRVLSLKEKDLIKGLATYLEFSDGTYPPTLNFDKAFVKHLDGFLAKAYRDRKFDKKQGDAKTLDIGFAGFFYNKLTRQKKDPVYYGETITVNDTDKVLVRWKISRNRYRVVYGSLKSETVTTEKLAELEKLVSE